MGDHDGVRVGDFLEATASAPVDAGVYRVVGTPGDDLVLLRVTGDRGRRTHTGEVVRVTANDLAGSSDDAPAAFEQASEPWPSVVGLLRNAIQGPYWLVRSLLPFEAHVALATLR